MNDEQAQEAHEEIARLRRERDAWINTTKATEEQNIRLRDECVHLRSELNAWVAALKIHTPYREWCRSPLICHDKMSCPRDPTCGD